jgi:hypothetical protein
MQDDAEKMLRDWEEAWKERELAEKRRVAPGWLDSDTRGVLEPEKKDSQAGAGANDIMDMDMDEAPAARQESAADQAGEELDRAFGALRVQ